MQIECAHEDGKVVFQDGSIVEADVIIHCTGYFQIHCPFLYLKTLFNHPEGKSSVAGTNYTYHFSSQMG